MESQTEGDKLTFRLCEDRIFVIDDEESETTEAGLILPGESGKEQMRYGTVSVVGIGHRSDNDGELIPIDIEVGDRVFFNRNSGSPITIDHVDYRCLASREIVGVVTA